MKLITSIVEVYQIIDNIKKTCKRPLTNFF